MTFLLFATPSYGYLRDAVCGLGGLEAGLIASRHFPDGELYQRYDTSVAGRDVVLIGGTVSDSETLALYDLAWGAVAQGARTLTLVIPFFGYATMERAVLPGEVVTAKARAQMFSHLPIASAGSRVVLLDLHSEGLPYYFENGLRPVHLYAKSLITRAARELGGSNFVLACTDAGRAKWVESLANDMGVSAAFVFKRRLADDRTSVAAISAQVQGQRVVLYDDMIRTGSSLLEAARAYLAAGASDIVALATHGIFPGDALQRLHAAGIFATIRCTDSHPRARLFEGPELQVDSIAELIVQYLSR